MLTDLPAYVSGLIIALALVGWTAYRHPAERAQMLRTFATILLVWIAGVSYVERTGNYTPWHFNLFVDIPAAFAVMWRPAGRVQGYIGLFYLFQIACHIAFGVRELGILGDRADPILYYDTITWIAWAQLAAIGVWCGGVWSDTILHRRRDRRDARNSRTSAANTRKAS